MASRIALLCLLGLLVASPAIATKSFDFYYLVLMWPGAYCAQSSCKAGCCAPTTGVMPKEDFFVSSFTTYSLTSDAPVTRCSNDSFSINEVVGIENLYYYWSSIKCPNNNGKSFWKSAWKNYGVCSGLEEAAYFEAALKLREKVNPLALLAAKGIKPDFGLFSVEKIKEAIQAGIGVTPAIQCSKAGPYDKFQLYQIHICVDKDASTFIDCPKVPRFTCSDEILFYPFKNWMLKAKPAVSYADPFELPGEAMEY